MVRSNLLSLFCTLHTKLILTLLAIFLAGMQTACTTTPVAPTIDAGTKPATDVSITVLRQNSEAPPAPREFRAAWVATVSNIDWPSRPDLSSQQQQAEIIAILDRAAELKLNAIILQVRPSADAIYPSRIEPWSEFLTGEQNKAPNPWYDPLQFWIEQAHVRGLELHAWFNPYRAKTALAKSALSSKHISKTHPGVVKQYGDLLWMDPSEPIAAKQTLEVITDVVHRYDVDGVHIDDYFYPYPIKSDSGAELEFPDDANWMIYQKKGGTLSRADWRRQNINRLVETIYHQVHQEKKWLKFGISPFGIGRPDRLPAGISGFSQYDKLYADVELWLANGWLDYLAPQLYWPIEQPAQAFRVLHNYWLNQNPHGRHIWPGLYTSRIDNTEKSWPVEEILRQISATRETPNSGHIHFSMAALMQNRKELQHRLSTESYQIATLVPGSPWLERMKTLAPEIDLSSNHRFVIVKPPDMTRSRILAIWKRYDQQWFFSVQPVAQLRINLNDDPKLGTLKQVVISVIDRTGQESGRASLIP